MTFVMYDSVTPEVIPASAPVVAGYVAGSWPTFPGLRARFPHARLLSIAPQASEDADVLDCEQGDASIYDAPAWFQRQKARGVAKPIIYTSISNCESLVAVMAGQHVECGEYLIWAAHIGLGQHICGPTTCHYNGWKGHADGTQWTFTALDRNLDESLLSDAFFPTAKPSPLAGLTDPEKTAARAYIALLSRPGDRGTPAFVAAKAKLVDIRQDVWRAAAKGYLNGKKVQPGWRIDRRDERYRALSKLVPPGK